MKDKSRRSTGLCVPGSHSDLDSEHSDSGDDLDMVDGDGDNDHGSVDDEDPNGDAGQGGVNDSVNQDCAQAPDQPTNRGK